MTTEDLLIKNIESAIRKIRNGTLQPSQSNIGSLFNRLKPLNPGMHDELMNSYKAVLKARNK